MKKVKFATLLCAGLFAASSAMASAPAPKGPTAGFCDIECGNYECWLAQKLFCPRTAPGGGSNVAEKMPTGTKD